MKKSRLSMWTSRILAVVFAASFLLFGAAPAFASGSMRSASASEAIGFDLSSISTTDINGNPVTGSLFKGKKTIVLHYFATWNVSVSSDLALMQQVSNSYPKSDVAVYGLLYEDANSTVSECASLMQSLGCNFPCLRLDATLNELVNLYPLIPQTFFVNSDGLVLEHYAGVFTDYSQLSEVVSGRVADSTVYHLVLFVDGVDGSIIKRAVVAHLASAQAPVPPTHTGYEFTGWSGSYTSVTENRTVTATYKALLSAFKPGDVNMDGHITVSDALSTLKVALGLITSDGVLLYGDMNGDGSITIFDAIAILNIAILN